MPSTRELDTPHGPARVHAYRGKGDVALVLGHGAGGSVDARDLVAVTEIAVALGATVVLVEQPYRVAGRKAAAPAPQLDAAWVSVLEQLAKSTLSGRTVVTLKGNHSLTADLDGVAAALGAWLPHVGR